MMPTEGDLEKKYGGNSYASRAPSGPQKKAPEKVIQGGLISKPKGIGRQIADVFFGEDVNSIGTYVMHDVLIPTIKNTITDVVCGAIEMLMGSDSHSSRPTSRGYGATKGSYYSYSGLSQSKKEGPRSQYSYQGANRVNREQIILETRWDADNVLATLNDYIIDYGSVSLGDLYGLVGKPTTHIDEKWGWYELTTATCRKVRDGWLLVLPRVTQIVE